MLSPAARSHGQADRRARGYAAPMGRVAERSQVTAAEYLAWEREQPAKHEFFHGEVFAMAGGTPISQSRSGSTASSTAQGALLPAAGCSVRPCQTQVSEISPLSARTACRTSVECRSA